MEFTVRVHFQNEINDVKMSQKKSLLNSLLDNKISILHSCGGNGTCGTCRIIILNGNENLSKPEEIEQTMISDRQFKSNERLSCQISPVKDLEIKIK